MDSLDAILALGANAEAVLLTERERVPPRLSLPPRPAADEPALRDLLESAGLPLGRVRQ